MNTGTTYKSLNSFKLVPAVNHSLKVHVHVLCEMIVSCFAV